MEQNVGTVTRLCLVSGVLLAAVFGLCWAQEGPELGVIGVDKPLRPGTAHRIEYEVRWAGEATDFTVFPAEFDPIDWGTARLVQIKTAFRDGHHVVVQTMEVVADQPGEYEFPEVRIAYLEPDTQLPPETQEPSTSPPASSTLPTLRAEPRALKVTPPRTFIWVSGIIVIIVVCAGLGWWWRRPRSKADLAAQSPKDEVDLDAVRQVVQSAKRHRLNGEFYDCYRDLGRAAELLLSPESELVQTLKNKVKDVGYRGGRPSEDQLDVDFREVERLIRRREENEE